MIVGVPSSKGVLIQVQFLYSVAIMLSVPLQLFPAVRIMENGLFVRSGKIDNKVKWLKKLFPISGGYCHNAYQLHRCS